MFGCSGNCSLADLECTVFKNSIHFRGIANKLRSSLQRNVLVSLAVGNPVYLLFDGFKTELFRLTVLDSNS